MERVEEWKYRKTMREGKGQKKNERMRREGIIN